MDGSAPDPEAVTSEAKNIDEYPESTSPRLRETIAEVLDVSPFQVCIGNGSDEIMDFACKAFLNPGNTVLLPIPTFSQYGLAAKANAMETKSVEMQNFRWDVDSLLDGLMDSEMAKEELKDLTSKAYKDFYFRLSFLWRRLSSS